MLLVPVLQEWSLIQSRQVSLCRRFILASIQLFGQFAPCSILDGTFPSTRLPDLSTVIMLDSKLPGTFHMDEVMQAGDSSHMKQLRALQQTLSCDEPVNIQFTSVGGSVCSRLVLGFLRGDAEKTLLDAELPLPNALFDQALALPFSSSAAEHRKSSRVSPFYFLLLNPLSRVAM